MTVTAQASPLAAEFDRGPADEHLRAAAELEAEQLRAVGITVTPDLSVRTIGAAMILGRAGKTLRNWRSCGVGPSWRADGGIVWYSLVDLLAWRGGVSRVVPISTASSMR